jgi:preprotein translocase subunit SecE
VLIGSISVGPPSFPVIAFDGLMNKIKNYLDEVIKEMRKVNWPSRKELVSNTGLTLLGAVIFSAFIYVADQGISFILQNIYR